MTAWPSASAGAHSETDTYNSYQWNRQSVEEQSNLIDSGDWYEWWYYKVYDPDSNEAYHFTYGVVNPWDAKQTLAGSKSVVQVGDFTRHMLVERNAPVTDFTARYDRPEVHIGKTFASDQRILGTVTEADGKTISWDLAIRKDWRFDAMGWGMKVRGISGIYWYPAQASARMTGWINYRGHRREFKDAPAYQDRNWGRTFPKWWAWIVSNHFKNAPDTVLAAGGGVPKIFNQFYGPTGLCIGLRHLGHEYVFRTTDGDSVHFQIRWGQWEIQAENEDNERIEISAFAPADRFMNLPFQTPQGPVFNDYEALTGHVLVRIFKRKFFNSDWIVVAELESDAAGIEWGSPDPVDFANLFRSEVRLQ